MKKYVLSLSLFIILLGVSGQKSYSQKLNTLQKDYSFVKSSGIIPEDISTLFSIKYAKDIEALKTSRISRKEREVKEEYLEQSHYYLNQMLTSGKIIYGSPFNIYLDKILDNLLVNEPDLRSKIKIYVLKSPEVNASATSQGIIFVNLGLIAQSGSEAQLAYILSHELIHYTKNHSITLYQEKDKLSRKKKGISSSLSDKNLFKIHFRSREMEGEADELGFKNYFAKSQYATEQIFETFDVLQYSYLPFDEIPFNQTYITDSVFSYPDDFFPKLVNPIKARDDYDDSKSTHPNLKKRREAMLAITEKSRNEGKEINLQGKDEFLYIRDMARFECIRLNLINNDFAEAFYNTWVMEQDYPDNLFLAHAKVASIYGLYKYKKAGKTYDVMPSERKTEGEMHTVVTLFSKMKAKEMCATSLRVAWKAKMKYPDEPYFNKIINDLLPDFIKSYKLNLNEFQTISQFQAALNSERNVEDSVLNIRQSRKLNNIQRKKALSTDKDYFSFMFADLIANSNFGDIYSSVYDSIQDKQNLKKSSKDKDDGDDEAVVIDEGAEIDEIDEMQAERRYMLKGCKIGINDILVYNPFYRKYDFRYDPELLFLESEEKQLDFISIYKKNAKNLGLNATMILPSEFSGQDQDIYNDHVLLNEWTDEFFNWKIKGAPVMFTSPEIAYISDKYKTKYLDLTGVVSSRAKSIVGTSNIILTSIVFPLYLPFAIYDAAKPSYYTVYYNMLIDMEAGKAVFITSSTFDKSDRKVFLKSKVYDSLNQIKSK